MYRKFSLLGGLAGILAGTALSPATHGRALSGASYTAIEEAQSFRRGKGKQAKRAKRSNRLTISKRVRRKHRRTA